MKYIFLWIGLICMGNNLYAQEEFLSYYKNYGTESFKVFVRPDDQLKTILATVYYYKEGQKRQKITTYWLTGYGEETKWKNNYLYRNDDWNSYHAETLFYDGKYLTLYVENSYYKDVLLFMEKQTISWLDKEETTWIEKRPVMVGDTFFKLFSADGIYEIKVTANKIVFTRKKASYIYTVLADQDKLLYQVITRELDRETGKILKESLSEPKERSISEEEKLLRYDVKAVWELRKKLEAEAIKNSSTPKK